MGDEAAKIDAWRRQMQQEEDDDYAAEQVVEEKREIARLGREEKAMRTSQTTNGLPGGGTIRFKEQPVEKLITPRQNAGAVPQRGRLDRPAEVDYSVSHMVPQRAAAAGPGAAPPSQPAAAGPAAVSSSFDWNANTMQQLQEFQGQNVGLQQQLKSKERELERYKRDIEMHALTGGIAESPGKGGHSQNGGSSLDPRDAKIVELAKKNRAMSLTVQREKDNASRLAGELKRTNQALQQVQANPEAMRMGTKMPSSAKAGTKSEPWSLTKGEGGEEPGSPDRRDEMKQMKERLKDTNHRLNTQTVAVGSLKQELSSVKRALAKEVGEGVDLKAVVDEGAGWKGRAQQISLLKDKLRESKRALEATRHNLTTQGGTAPTMTMADMQAQSAASAALASDKGYGNSPRTPHRRFAIPIPGAVL